MLKLKSYYFLKKEVTCIVFIPIIWVFLPAIWPHGDVTDLSRPGIKMWDVANWCLDLFTPLCKNIYIYSHSLNVFTFCHNQVFNVICVIEQHKSMTVKWRESEMENQMDSTWTLGLNSCPSWTELGTLTRPVQNTDTFCLNYGCPTTVLNGWCPVCFRCIPSSKKPSKLLGVSSGGASF